MSTNAEVVTVTPVMAESWLATSKLNRDISKTSVLEWTIAMARGEWRADGPPITFLEDGSLSNGHHRLHAIIQFGHPVKVTVQRGVSKATREVEDSGRTRTLRDKITMFRPRTTNVVRQLAWLRFSVQLLSPWVRVRSMSDWDLWTGVFREGLKWAVDNFSDAQTSHCTGPIAGTLVFAHATNPEAVESFGAQLVSGEGLKAGDPCHTLRKFIEHGMGGENKSRVVVGRKVLACVDAHINGQRMTSTHVRSGIVALFMEPYRTKSVQALIAPWEESLLKKT